MLEEDDVCQQANMLIVIGWLLDGNVAIWWWCLKALWFGGVVGRGLASLQQMLLLLMQLRLRCSLVKVWGW